MSPRPERRGYAEKTPFGAKNTSRCQALSPEGGSFRLAVPFRVWGIPVWAVFALVCLAACLTPPAAQAAAVIDREAAYKSALPLYADDARQPLAVRVQSTTAFGTGKLLRFSYASTNGQRVPALLFLPRAASRAHPVPCLVALHGLGGSKEFMAGFAQYALGLGDATLAIDEYGQGERPPVPEAAGGPDLAVLATGIRQTAVDVRRGLDFLDTRPDIAHGRIGLAGVSLGAIIGTVAAGVDPRVKAVVLISGGGDWGLILQSLAERGMSINGRPMAALRGTDWDAVRVQLAPVDPLTFAAHVAPRPLLMENGGADRIIVPAAAQALYDAARRAPRSRAHLDWFPAAGHLPPPEQTYPKIKRWLTANL